MTTPDTTTPTGNIHLALAAIMRDMIAIQKDKKNEAQGFKFRGIDDVYNELHPIFAAHGVVCIPFVDKAEHKDAGVTSKGNVITRAIVYMGYRFTAADGSSTEAKTIGEGMDSADKATAKALSVAHKYLLLQTFLIPTADLVDADYYEPTVNAREELALKAKDKKAIEMMISQRLEDAENATGERKKELLGLASELRCKLAELDEPTPAKTVETTVLPPETTKPAPAARKARPTPQPATEATSDEQTKQTPWQEFKGHVGAADSIYLGPLGKCFAKATSKKRLDSIVDGFKTMLSGSPIPKDVLLWKKVQEAAAAWTPPTSEPPTSPASASTTETAATTPPNAETPAQQPAAHKGWRDYEITQKSSFTGKKLGELTVEEINRIKTDYLDKLPDPSRLTIQQRALSANVALALDELTPRDLEHTLELKTRIERDALNRNSFMDMLKKNGWVHDGAVRIEDITDDEAQPLFSDWQTVVEETRLVSP